MTASRTLAVQPIATYEQLYALDYGVTVITHDGIAYQMSYDGYATYPGERHLYVRSSIALPAIAITPDSARAVIDQIIKGATS